MSAPKKRRRPGVMPPPPRRAATATPTPSVREGDLADLAREVGLELVAGATSHSSLAHETTEALHNYALLHRMDHAAAGAGEVKRWAAALQQWAADGLVLLGGTLDGNMKAEGFPLPHSVPAGHLADAWPASDVDFHLEYLLHMATGRRFSPEERGDSPGEHDLVHCSAAALELLKILAASLEQRAASMPRVTRPTEHARDELLRALRDLFERLHEREVTVVRAAVRDPGNGRDQLPGGPALAWFRGLFSLVAGRGDDPVMAALAEWAQKTDALADALRKISGKMRRISL